jgi:DNA gyrase subunit A
MVCIRDAQKQSILVVSEKGYGKRSDLEDYRVTNRGGKGVKTLNITDKTGKLIAIKTVVDGDDLMIINKSGITIRMAMKDLRVMGRATQGVRLIKLEDDDAIASVAKVDNEMIEEEISETTYMPPVSPEENGTEPSTQNPEDDSSTEHNNEPDENNPEA